MMGTYWAVGGGGAADHSGGGLIEAIDLGLVAAGGLVVGDQLSGLVSRWRGEEVLDNERLA